MTTEAKAKELRPFIEKLVTIARNNTLAAKRTIAGRISSAVLPALFGKIAPKYKTRNGGYTRIVKVGRRKSDGSEMAVIEFV
jgi:large subunit ribosomal protein L17